MITNEKDALDPAVMKLAKSICRSESFPMLIVDDQLFCVYSSCSKLVPVGTMISLFIKEPIEIPLKKERDVILIREDVSYCARFIPIDKKYSFCQLLSVSDIMTMAAYTDMYSAIEGRFFLLDECSGNIKKYAEKMFDGLPPKTKLKNMQMLDLNAEISKLNFLLNSMSDYAYMALSSNSVDEIIDTHAMVEWLINKSNAVLSECGKCLEFITEIGAYFIYSNQRYAIIAILNAMQNALLYSPISDVPIVSLTKSERDNKKYIVVQIVNSIESFTKADEKSDPDFICRRCGLGIPLIKKFVQRAGGEFYFEKSGSKARVGIMIPEYIPEDKDTFEMEGGKFSMYDFGGRNIVEDMMQDVISSIAKKKKPH